MVKSAQRKEVLKNWMKQGWLSERKACQIAGISRSGLRYRCQRPEQDKQLKEALLAKASQYPRYGYLMLHALLTNEGLAVNRKALHRSWTAGEDQEAKETASPKSADDRAHQGQ